MSNKIFFLLLLLYPAQHVFSQITLGQSKPQLEIIPDKYLLKTNLVISKTAFFENTAKVITPSKIFPGGLIVATTGQLRSESGIQVMPIYEADGKTIYNNATVHTGNMSAAYYLFSTIMPASASAHTDNQTVKLPNGDILVLKEHCTWAPITNNPPVYMNENILGEGGFHKGNRGAISFFKISAAGQSSNLKGFLNNTLGIAKPVQYISTLDLGTFEGGKYAYPQTESGNYVIGGQDRSELYVCPYTGNIYLSFKYGSGAYAGHNNVLGTLLLVSKDAKTWKLVREFPYGSNGIYAPLVITSTPNKRLIIFSGWGSDNGMELPRMYYSDLYGMESMDIKLFGPFFINVDDEKGNLIRYDYNKDFVDMFQNTAYFCSISRICDDASSIISRVRVSVHMKSADNTMEAKLIEVSMYGDRAPVGHFIKTIKADNPQTNSVLYGSFIDPDPLASPFPNANLSVFYWLEVPKVTASPHLYSARYVLISGDQVSASSYLSVQPGTGAARKWTTRQDLGDFASGGFYYYNDHFNFLTQWVEPDGIKANIISVPVSELTKSSAKSNVYQ